MKAGELEETDVRSARGFAISSWIFASGALDMMAVLGEVVVGLRCFGDLRCWLKVEVFAKVKRSQHVHFSLSAILRLPSDRP